MIDKNTLLSVKIVNRMRLLRDFLGRKDKTAGLPIEVGIEIINVCNLRCIMCPYEEMVKDKIRSQGKMSFPLFKKVIKQIAPSAEIIYLHGMGEPFLHPQLFKFINFAKTNNLRVGLSTNATLVDQTKAKQLLDTKLDYLIFAVDGATKATYEKIRVGASLEKVDANIRQFLKLKRKSKNKPFVVIQFISMDENEKEAAIFRKKWRQEGVNIVRIKPKMALKKSDKNNNVEKKPYCFHIFRQLNIFHDGTVLPCCEDVHGLYPLGNLKKQSLNEIWNGAKMMKLRKINFQNQQNQISLCKNCEYFQPTIPQAIGALALNHFAFKKILPHLEKWL